MVKTAVTLSGVLLDNPVIPASGTFGFGYEFAQWYDINCLGAISIKGTTREPRFGNPAPRIAETAGGMLNAVGLQNPGIDRVVAEELPKLREVYQKPILANISGFSLDEYVTCCAKADASPYTDLIEVNVSCPNVHHGGMSFGTDPHMVYDVTRAMMEGALEGVTRPDGSRPLVIAVTQLTSTSQTRMQEELLIPRTMEETVMAYAANAAQAGLDGVVCSPMEAGKVHEACGRNFVTVTPGIRFAEGDKGDQVRVTTPAQAKDLGSDYIVVGRPITAAADPVAAYERCVREFTD